MDKWKSDTPLLDFLFNAWAFLMLLFVVGAAFFASYNLAGIKPLTPTEIAQRQIEREQRQAAIDSEYARLKSEVGQ